MMELSRINNREVFGAQEEPSARSASAAKDRPDLSPRNWWASGRAVGWAAGKLALVSLAGAGALAQQSSTGTLKGGVTYTDQSSDNCEQQNANNPFAGMNPLVCHGEMAPTDSRGQCTLGGWQVLKKVDSTCYYCVPITSPRSIIIPMDQVRNASLQGWDAARIKPISAW